MPNDEKLTLPPRREVNFGCSVRSQLMKSLFGILTVVSRRFGIPAVNKDEFIQRLSSL